MKLPGTLQAGSFVSLRGYVTACSPLATLSPSSTSVDLATPGMSPPWAASSSQKPEHRGEGSTAGTPAQIAAANPLCTCHTHDRSPRDAEV